jgi:hypothetical protein
MRHDGRQSNKLENLKWDKNRGSVVEEGHTIMNLGMTIYFVATKPPNERAIRGVVVIDSLVESVELERFELRRCCAKSGPPGQYPYHWTSLHVTFN